MTLAMMLVMACFIKNLFVLLTFWKCVRFFPCDFNRILHKYRIIGFAIRDPPDMSLLYFTFNFKINRCRRKQAVYNFTAIILKCSTYIYIKIKADKKV